MSINKIELSVLRIIPVSRQKKIKRNKFGKKKKKFFRLLGSFQFSWPGTLLDYSNLFALQSRKPNESNNLNKLNAVTIVQLILSQLAGLVIFHF